MTNAMAALRARYGQPMYVAGDMLLVRIAVNSYTDANLKAGQIRRAQFLGKGVPFPYKVFGDNDYDILAFDEVVVMRKLEK